MKSISNEIRIASESEFRHSRALPLPSCHARLKQHSGVRGSAQNGGVEVVPKQTKAEKNCQGQTAGWRIRRSERGNNFAEDELMWESAKDDFIWY